MFLFALPARAQQSLELHVESEELYANLPFVLTAFARGFAEAPEPRLTPSPPRIPGCKVTPLGVTPNVSSMVQIINGQRSEYRNVSYAFRFRVEAEKPGQYEVPALTAEQNGKRAQSPPARFTVRALEDTQDMKILLNLPSRPLWTGETFDASLDWYLRREVGNRTFVVPLFEQDAIDVEPAPADASAPRLRGFSAGTRQLELPYTRDQATLDGTTYTRFRFLVRLTVTRPGTLTAPPPRVMAELPAGFARDTFGFPIQQTRLFQAVGKPARLEVRPLPLSGRPESFANAVGTAFSLDVQVGRSVVRMGEPVELRITLRGNGRLPGLMLPDLHRAGLPPGDFSAPDEPAAGELTDNGKDKLFRVPVRLRSTAVREVPPLRFSYFDPEKGTYQTVQSQPVALSVSGSAVVGADQVVAAPHPAETPAPAAPAPASTRPATDLAAFTLPGADLALSDERGAGRKVWRSADVAPALVVLYGGPLLLLFGMVWRRRNAPAHAYKGRVDAALRRLSDAVAAAAQGPAREHGPVVAEALRALRRVAAEGGGAEGAAGEALLDRLETEAYSPQAGQAPLPAALREEAVALGRSWARSTPRRGGGGAAAALVLLALLPALPAQAGPTQEPGVVMHEARGLYQQALAEHDAEARRAGFARAEALLRGLAGRFPDHPELLCDWGNAALMAQDPGLAVLAYRRALRLDPGLLRARRNLALLRGRLPEWLPRPRSEGTLDTLLFWQRMLPAAQRQIIGALAFALMVLLLCPWPWRGAAARRGLAVLPGALWLAMVASLVAGSGDRPGDAVVREQGVVLRSADSLGAPPALAQPLPAGAEVHVSESRGDWARVDLASGQTGWVPSSTLEMI